MFNARAATRLRPELPSGIPIDCTLTSASIGGAGAGSLPPRNSHPLPFTFNRGNLQIVNKTTT
jgi:hypothetical protein